MNSAILRITRTIKIKRNSCFYLTTIWYFINFCSILFIVHKINIFFYISSLVIYFFLNIHFILYIIANTMFLYLHLPYIYSYIYFSFYTMHISLCIHKLVLTKIMLFIYFLFLFNNIIGLYSSVFIYLNIIYRDH